MKVLALDIGDKWVGSALSDGLKMTCKPYKTVIISEINDFLSVTLKQENISTVLVGYPKTLSGGSSEQTLKTEKIKSELESKFSLFDGKSISWLLWDERLSSKRAEELHRGATTPEAKQKSHSVAAAFILQSYLDNLAWKTIE